MSLSLEGRTYVVMGVANKRSIAWGISRSLANAGARIVFTYAGERLGKNVRELADTLETETFVYPCDIMSDEEIDATFRQIKDEVGSIHGLAHCIAFAKTEDLEGSFVETSRDGFQLAHDISAYSLTAVANAVQKNDMMAENGSIMTMTYLGGERVVRNYNVMGVAKAALDASVRYLANDLGQHGIRVNAISAGPIRTLSAKGISGFNSSQKEMEEKAPLRRTVTQEEVGNTALFLMSDLSKGMTGETLHVDGGYHIIGLG
ncbi:enoyl-[acyl-carrier-protein] reductase FabI [Salicibibacter halophilus]|uniref:Enoyl-[acyl-carrier-protein] reductase [NADH] n=1 Tax=Salicibibacter halophilus TaxID=2502791 RepID=A0A514LG87_9BACI|nr:enoyl-ACP reductase FabI [Salicibibacter halophilus]QDI90872.1 enoyl-[acyl-carrier-protein] reductase FabI [Salicibibacter halophilus]